MKFYAELHKTQ